MSKKCFILDGHSLAYRMFFALPSLASKGKPIGAVYGFTRVLLKLIKEDNPDYIIVCFDPKGPTFRHQKFKEYKAHRDKTPDELKPQFEMIKDILTAFAIPTIEMEGFEADDVLGTLAQQAQKRGIEAIIFTGDKDSLQLVNEKIQVRYTRKGLSDLVQYDLQKIREEYGLEPVKLIEVKALMGDSSDNIPGVPGVGEKTALKLIKAYHDLEAVYSNLRRISGKKLRMSLEQNREQAFLSKEMVTIKTDLNLEEDLLAQEWPKPDWEKVASLFREWEFTSLLESLPQSNEISTENNQDDFTAIIVDSTNWQEFITGFEPLEFLPVFFDIKGEGARKYSIEEIGITDKNNNYILKVANLNCAQIQKFFTQIFNDDKLKIVTHNGKAALEVLMRTGVSIKNYEFDTAIAAYLLNISAADNDFNFLLERLLGHKAGSVAECAFYLPQIRLKQLQALKEIEALDLFYQVEMPLIPILAEMELNGITLDQNSLQEISIELEQKINKVVNQIYQYTNKEFNVNSPKQLGAVLFDDLGLPIIKKTKTGYGTGVDVLEKLRDKHPVVPLVMENRQLTKLKSTYIDALPPLINQETKRIHTSFKQTVTQTGRLASSDPNLQNIPIRTQEGQRIRKAFQAASSYKLIAADYSQIELRVLAHIANEEGLKKAFQSGEDIHSSTAKEIFDLTEAQLNSEYRRRAKAINFGIAYGMSAYGLSQDLNCAPKEAQHFIDRYFSRFPQIKSFIDTAIATAKEKGYVSTILNRRRYLPDISHRIAHRRGFAERMAINTPIQGSAADIMKLAMINVYQQIKDISGVRMLLQVHDELILEAKEGMIKEIGLILKKGMEQAYKLDVPLEVEVKWGDNWLEMTSLS